jgi:hypothetical protein
MPPGGNFCKRGKAGLIYPKVPELPPQNLQSRPRAGKVGFLR